MSTRTDAPARTDTPITAAPDSQLVASPAASPAVQAADEHPILHESLRAIFSSQQRAGRWEPADEIEAQGIFGEITLDFTRAELPPSGMVEIDALAFCGEVTIILPDGADVEIEGTPVLGSIEQQVRKRGAAQRIREWVTGEHDEDLPVSPPPREPPYFRIDARAILGSIKVMGR